MSQAAHGSSQRALQHTPSTQKLLVHSASAAQTAPEPDCVTHSPPMQALPAPQAFGSAAHAPLQPVPAALQPSARQLSSCSAGQLPLPTQRASASVVAGSPALMPATHCPTRQTLPVGYAHALRSVPPHEPPQVLPSWAHTARPPCGASPLGVALQTPRLASTSQASH
jgi:hypothetical protein